MHALGRGEEADYALAELAENFGGQWPSEVAHVYAYRGDADSAFAWLEKEYEAYGPGGRGEWQLQPLYASLRADPRWHQYLARAGATPEQLGQYQLTVPLLSQQSSIL